MKRFENWKSYVCPCSSNAVPLPPPMSHTITAWSKEPEKSICLSISQARDWIDPLWPCGKTKVIWVRIWTLYENLGQVRHSKARNKKAREGWAGQRSWENKGKAKKGEEVEKLGYERTARSLGKGRQGKANQGTVRQGKVRWGYLIQGKTTETRQKMARLNKVRQDMERQGKVTNQG